MNKRNVIIAAVVGLVIIELLTLYFKKAPIEEALRLETARAFDQVGASIELVEFDGRDATLKGVVSTEEEKRQLEAILDTVWDVRIVYNELQVDSSDIVKEEPEEEPELIEGLKGFLMQEVNGVLVLQGQVQNEESKSEIVAAALDAFPALQVEDKLQVNAASATAWVPTLLRAISAISIVKQPEIQIDAAGDSLSLAGVVAAAFQKNAVLSDLTNALQGSLALGERLAIVEPERDPKLVALEKRIQSLQTTTRIQFKINTAFLADLSKEVLNQVAEILKEAPGAAIEVEGHTDNLGSRETNMRLSQERADAVRNYLISQGIEASRLSAVGYGPTRPVATNSTRQGRIANRRVVFSLKGGS